MDTLEESSGINVNSEDFKSKIEQMVTEKRISRKDAKLEVYINEVVNKTGNLNDALIYVLSEEQKGDDKQHHTVEDKVMKYVTRLLNLGAQTTAMNKDGHMALHIATKRKFEDIVKLLIDNGANPETPARNGELPLHVALQNKFDDISVLLIGKMKHETVRFIFQGKADNNEADSRQRISFRECILQKRKEVVSAVLNCFIDTDHLSSAAVVHYGILEEDDNGLIPLESGYNKLSQTPLHLIIQDGDKDVMCHEVVRLLVRRKWNKYARFRFMLNFLRNMVFLFCVTFSAIVGVMAQNPLVYDTPLHITRAVLEVASVLMVLYKIFVEIFQIQRHRLEYFKDMFNWLDIVSSVLLLIVVPLRFAGSLAQWYLFASGYMMTFLRIFKFAMVFNTTGAYVRILGKVIVHDFLQFGIVFVIFLFAFTCTFFMILRGDNNVELNEHTSTFGGIMYIGVRSLVEVGRVIDYTAEHGYGGVNSMLYLWFIFTCVIMLNLLIAQLAYTYTNVQQDVMRELYVSRAWIVDSVDRNSFFIDKLLQRICPKMDFRKRFYLPQEPIADYKNLMKKWEILVVKEDTNEELEALKTLNRSDIISIKETVESLRRNGISIMDYKTARANPVASNNIMGNNNLFYNQEHGEENHQLQKDLEEARNRIKKQEAELLELRSKLIAAVKPKTDPDSESSEDDDEENGQGKRRNGEEIRLLNLHKGNAGK